MHLIGVACGLYKAHMEAKSIYRATILLASKALEIHLFSSQQQIISFITRLAVVKVI